MAQARAGWVLLQVPNHRERLRRWQTETWTLAAVLVGTRGKEVAGDKASVFLVRLALSIMAVETTG